AVYALDSPLNAKHGRAKQLADWGYDEAGLSAHVAAPVLLVVDETALRERDRRDWLGSVCSRVVVGAPSGRVDLFGGRRRFALYRATVPAGAIQAQDPDRCVVWTAAWKASGS
ncbi:MAG: 4-amino-4-deoxy-L-arabinose transferase, partial [Luteibacter sp.]